MENSSFPLFLLSFFSLLLLSSSSSTPTEYFISCGSSSDVSYTDRNFAGDSNSSNSLPFTLKGKSNSVRNPTELNPLYRTARNFTRKSSYELKIKTRGIYVVRFHFSSNSNFTSARFDVSASGFSLLKNFTPKPPIIVEEFLLNLNTGILTLEFLPLDSSFAFVNAIEVFIAPDKFIPDNSPHITPAGGNINDYQKILSKVLRTVHRINVGGPKLTPENDTLWRNWVPDDDFIHIPETAKDLSSLANPKYGPGIDRNIAPDQVYQTCKEMSNSSNSVSNSFNITWSFSVAKRATHFVRVHFCDIISKTLSDLAFNLFIYSKFGTKIYPYEEIDQLAAPFYKDFVVDSDDSGFLNISVGPRGDSGTKNAFLNGVEILEIPGESPVLKDEPQKIGVVVVVGSVLGGLAVVSMLGIGVFLCLKCRKPKTVKFMGWSEGSPTNAQIPDLGLRIPLTEIQFATNNFDPILIVGKGGFGRVYKGTLRNGMKVAVKRSEPGSGQGLSEFQTEIMVLSKIRHRHLVSLIGYCNEMSEMILVYEFMENGTLRDHLYKSNLPPLSWSQRLEICIGAAKGLHYLHRGAAGRFIHRDVKSTNILLDEFLVAKVADFGLSRLGSPDETHVSTNVKGTFGYLDPDYFRTQQLTEKSDVYSFGVVLFEVLCARPAINTLLTRDEVNLAEWALFHKSNGLLDQIVDPSIKDQVNPNSLRKFSEIAEKCLEEYGVDRPGMADVQWDLEYALQLQQRSGQGETLGESGNVDSGMIMMPNVSRLPSFSVSIERDDAPTVTDSSSDLWATDVFSQLRIENAR